MKTLFSYFQQFSLPKVRKTRLQAGFVTNNQILKNVIHRIDSKYEWMLLSVTVTAKPDLVFVLTFENAFS